MSQHSSKHIIEAALLTAGKPLTLLQLQTLLSDDETPLDKQFVLAALDALADDLSGRGVELRQVASGYRLQVKQEFEPWIARLFEERPPRYSRALLETLALIAYRQPITRAEIEDVRGVSVSSNIVKTLLEREWIKVVGQRDVPGRPSMYGTTKTFLDYFNIKAVSELPPLDELMDLDTIDKQLDMLDPQAAANLPVETPDGAEDAPEAGDAEVVAGDAATAHAAGADVSSESDVATEPDDPSAGEADSADVNTVGQVSDRKHPGSAAVVALPLAGATKSPDTDGGAAEPADGRAEVLDETADIDSLVHMLDQIDQAEPDAKQSVDAPAAPEPDAAPSALAQQGETAAAVEAARLALAEQAEQVLDHISERDDAASSTSGLMHGAASAERAPTEGDLASPESADTLPGDTALDEAVRSGSGEFDDAQRADGLDVEPVSPASPDLGTHDGATSDRSSPDDAHIAALIDADSRNHEAARGESITPADSLRRSSTDNTD